MQQALAPPQATATAVSVDPFDTSPPDPFGGAFADKTPKQSSDTNLEEFFGRADNLGAAASSTAEAASPSFAAAFAADSDQAGEEQGWEQGGSVMTVEELDIWGAPDASALANDEDDEAGARGGGSARKPKAREDNEEEDDDDDNVEVGLELQGASMETYEVTFPYEVKLGMLLERFDESSDDGDGRFRERTLVKMVLDGGAADVRGVQVGSKMVSLNGQPVLTKTYLETLEMVKTLARPLKVVMEKVGTYTDSSQGICYIRKDFGYNAPSKLAQWTQQYFVVGGAVAKQNVLQLYDTKADYEEVVVSMFQNKDIHHIPFKAYKLGLSFKCGACTTKTYPGRKLVTYFWLKNPTSKTKVLKIGGDNASVLTGLHIQIAKYTSAG